MGAGGGAADVGTGSLKHGFWKLAPTVGREMARTLQSVPIIACIRTRQQAAAATVRDLAAPHGVGDESRVPSAAAGMPPPR